MKRIFGLLILAGVLFSCADEATGSKTYKGNFLLFEGNAVLEVNEQMYAITNDAITQELAEKAKNFQNTEFDMVPVTIEASVKPKPANTEGWDSILTIEKIIEISPVAVGPDIQIEETQQ